MDELAWATLVCVYLGLIGQYMRGYVKEFWWWVLLDCMAWVFTYYGFLGALVMIGDAYAR